MPIDTKAIYAALSAPLPEKAIQRTKTSDTKKGYDTTGFGYQFVVNRFNEVLGVGGWRTERTYEQFDRESGTGKYMCEVVCEIRLELGEWVRLEGEALACALAQGKGITLWAPFAEAFATGGHTSSNLADARKGAFTNGFKKAAAFFGVGRQAYEDTIDDDGEALDAAPVRAPQRDTKPQNRTNDYENRPPPPNLGHNKAEPPASTAGPRPPVSNAPAPTEPHSAPALRGLLGVVRERFVKQLGEAEAGALWHADVLPRIEGLDRQQRRTQDEVLRGLDLLLAETLKKAAGARR